MRRWKRKKRRGGEGRRASSSDPFGLSSEKLGSKEGETSRKYARKAGAKAGV